MNSAWINFSLISTNSPNYQISMDRSPPSPSLKPFFCFWFLQSSNFTKSKTHKTNISVFIIPWRASKTLRFSPLIRLLVREEIRTIHYQIKMLSLFLLYVSLLLLFCANRVKTKEYTLRLFLADSLLDKPNCS